MSNSSFRVSGAYSIRETRLVAHYHPKTGDILHMYTATVFEGAEPLSDGLLLEQALEVAKAAGVKALSKRPYIIVNDPGILAHPCKIDVKTAEIQALAGEPFKPLAGISLREKAAKSARRSE